MKKTIISLVLILFLSILVGCANNKEKNDNNEEKIKLEYLGKWEWEKNGDIEATSKKLDHIIQDHLDKGNKDCKTLTYVSGVMPNYYLEIYKDGKVELTKYDPSYSSNCEHGMLEYIYYGKLDGKTIKYSKKTIEGKEFEFEDYELKSKYTIKITDGKLEYKTEYENGSTLEDYFVLKSDEEKKDNYNGKIFDLIDMGNSKEEVQEFIEEVNKNIKNDKSKLTFKNKKDSFNKYDNKNYTYYYYQLGDGEDWKFSFSIDFEKETGKFNGISIYEGESYEDFDNLRMSIIKTSGLYNQCIKNSDCKLAISASTNKEDTARLSEYTITTQNSSTGHIFYLWPR